MAKNKRNRTSRSRCVDCGQTFNARDITATDRGRVCAGCNRLAASGSAAPSDVDVDGLVASLAAFRGDKDAARQRRRAAKRRRRDE